MIRIKSLNKSFGDLRAVKDLNISINPGEIYGLVGPDGAGKTTTLRLMVGALTSDGGSISISGFDLHKNTELVRSKIGYLSQRFSLYEDLSVIENIRFFAEVRGISHSEWYARSQEILEFVGLADYKDRLAGNLSGGMKQKLGLASAMVGLPSVLLLDEPTTGVDPVTRQDFWQLLVRLVSQSKVSTDKVTVLITTPYMDEAVRCNRIGFMQNGQLISEGSPSRLRSALDGRIFEIRCSALREVSRMCSLIPGVENVRLFGDRLLIRLRHGFQHQVVEEIKEKAEDGLMEISSIKQVQASLEDVFVFLAGSELDDPALASDPLKQEFSEALKVLFELVPPVKFNWSLSGSAGLKIRGINIPIHDLDIQCSLDHIYQIERKLKKYMKSPVQPLTTGRIRSLLGKARIDGIDIDLIAQMQVEDEEGQWEDLVDLYQKKWMDWQGFQLPVLPLEMEIQIYTALGRESRAQQIQAFLTQERASING
ncbi:ATP-binding cassette domain-containing protein [Chloroflexota bacterium]